MAHRLVTPSDLEKNPDLLKQGVSVNQHYNFPDEENGNEEHASITVPDDKAESETNQNALTNLVPIDAPIEEIKEKRKKVPSRSPQKVEKAAPKKAATKTKKK